MNVLEISTHTGCRHSCEFCPQGTLIKEYKKRQDHHLYFSMADFKAIIDKLPKDVRVDFSGYAEPFFHPEAPEMVAYAKQQGHSVFIYTTLSGITDDGFEILKNTPVEFWKIHLPDKFGLIIDDNEFIAQHNKFLATGIKATYMAMGELTDVIKKYLDDLDIKVEMPTMLSRSGNVKIVKLNHKHSAKLKCSMDRWHQNVVLPNGEIAGCCMDYGLEVILGNLLTQSYQEIYDEAERWKNNDHSNDICSRCEWSTY